MTNSQWLIFIGVVLLIGIVLIYGRFTKGGTAPTPEDDAKRFAFLLIAEIKLSEPYKVERGLKTNDLLGCLKDEIKAARAKYRRRIQGRQFDSIFDDALLSILADGDASKLGQQFAKDHDKFVQ